MIKKYIIDRIEGDFAVCECENEMKIHIPLKKLPSGVKESNIIIFENGMYCIESKEITEEIRKNNINLQNSLFE